MPKIRPTKAHSYDCELSKKRATPQTTVVSTGPGPRSRSSLSSANAGDSLGTPKLYVMLATPSCNLQHILLQGIQPEPPRVLHSMDSDSPNVIATRAAKNLRNHWKRHPGDVVAILLVDVYDIELLAISNGKTSTRFIAKDVIEPHRIFVAGGLFPAVLDHEDAFSSFIADPSKVVDISAAVKSQDPEISTASNEEDEVDGIDGKCSVLRLDRLIRPSYSSE
jgi:hypothetical protein